MELFIDILDLLIGKLISVLKLLNVINEILVVFSMSFELVDDNLDCAEQHEEECDGESQDDSNKGTTFELWLFGHAVTSHAELVGEAFKGA